MKIGFIGLGNMGQEIAKHLLRVNHQLMVWNRTEGKTAALTNAGAILARSLEEVMENNIVFSMLSDDQAIEELLIQSDVFDGALDGIIHVNLSTISPMLASRLAAFHKKRRQKYISAPVLGRPDVAKAGKLTIVAAGDLQVLPSIQPLFDSFGQKTWNLGPLAEKANVVKLANNLMLATAVESMSEASAFVNGYGLNAGQLLEITNSGPFACLAYQSYSDAIANDSSDPVEFSVHLGAKDVRLGLAAAEEINVPMPLSSVVRDSLLEAKAMGEEYKDWGAVLGRVSRARAGRH
jgi:3-hydroxyisobutyrate dehydrogenase-like beta-hydroxyacid dehydrogenase